MPLSKIQKLLPQPSRNVPEQNFNRAVINERKPSCVPGGLQLLQSLEVLNDKGVNSLAQCDERPLVRYSRAPRN